MQVPGSSLQFTLEVPAPPQFLGLVFDERYLLCKKTDRSEVHVFDMLTGELKDTIFTSNGDLHVTPDGRHFVIVDQVTEKSLKIHESGTGAFLGQVILLRHIHIRADRYHAGPLSLTNDRLCAVVETADTSYLFVCEVRTGSTIDLLTRIRCRCGWWRCGWCRWEVEGVPVWGVPVGRGGGAGVGGAVESGVPVWGVPVENGVPVCVCVCGGGGCRWRVGCRCGGGAGGEWGAGVGGVGGEWSVGVGVPVKSRMQVWGMPVWVVPVVLATFNIYG